MWWQNQNIEGCHFEVIWLVGLSGCHRHSSFLFLSVRSQFTFPFLISLLQLPLALPSIIATPLAVLLQPPCFSPSLPSSVPHSLIPSGSDIFLHLQKGCATQMCFLKKKLKLGPPTPAPQTQPPAVIQSLAFEISSCPDLTALYRLLFGVYSRNHLDTLTGWNQSSLVGVTEGGIRCLPVSEGVLCLWSWGLGKGRLPLDLVMQRTAARAERALRPWRQHDSIDFQLLVKGIEFNGSDGRIAGIKSQGEGHVAEHMLGSKVDALLPFSDKLYVGNSWVV